MMPSYLAICIEKSALKAIPETEGLNPFQNSKQFSKDNPYLTVVNTNFYYTEFDKETIISFEAQSRELAKALLTENYPNLFIRYLRENRN